MADTPYHGHWENRKPGPGISIPMIGLNDPYWQFAWDNGFTWVFDGHDYLHELPSGGSPPPGFANPAVSNGDANGWLPIIFGRRRVAAPILVQHEDASWGWQCIVVIGEGEIGSIGRVWCNGHEIANTGAPGFGWIFYPGTPSGDHNAFLDARANAGDFPPYTSASTEVALPNTAYMNIQITTDAVNKAWGTLVPGGGAPTFEVEVLTGRKVYDHRDGGQVFATPSTWLSSDNPWLAIRDLLANSRWGANYSTINDTSFDAAATIADSMVGSPSAKRFTTNDLILERAGLNQHLAQLYLACNGDTYWSDSGVAAFCDVENAGAAVMTLDTANNFKDVTFEDLTGKDQPTQVVITYKNIAIDFADDTIRVPATVTGEIRTAEYTFGAITDVVHATRAGAYILNQNIVTPVRGAGTASQAGIILGVGNKVDVTTSDGPAAAPFLVTASELVDGQFSLRLRQYDASVYDDIAHDTQIPVITDLKPPWGPPTAITFPVITTAPYCYWNPPRLLDGGTGVTTAWGGAPSDAYAHVDLGAGVQKKMGRFKSFFTGAGPGSFGYMPGPPTAVEWSDDDSSWTAVSGLVANSWRQMGSPTLINFVVAEWTTPVAAHRYWRAYFGVWGVPAPDAGASLFYDVLSEVDPYVTGYEVHNSSTNMLLGFPENDPVFTVVPAANRPTVDKPLDLRTIVFVISNTTQTARPCIVPVSNGLLGTEPVLLIEDAAAVGFYPAAQSSAMATARQAGVAMDVDSVAADFIDLATATPGLSAAGHARLKTDGAAVLASINGGAYAALGGGGSGTVTSVDLSAPSDLLAVGGNPITGAGTLALTKPATTAPNTVYAGPASGGAGAAAFRQLVAGDMPTGVAAPPVTTKGDLFGFSTVPARFPVGADGKLPFADSAAAIGLSYQYPLVLIVETPAGVIDSVNDTFVLSQPPVTKVALIVDGQNVKGGRTWGQGGTGNQTIQFAFGANLPTRTILAIYEARMAISTASPDTLPIGTALSWVTESMPAYDWRKVVWAPELGLFCALNITGGAAGASIATSPDGVTWTGQTTPGTDNLSAHLCWNGTQFLAGVLATPWDKVMTSPDGVNWTLHTATIDTANLDLGECVWAPALGYYIASRHANHGAGPWMTSGDGLAWTDRLAGGTPTASNLGSLCWSDELRLAVGIMDQLVVYSSDGITWHYGTAPANSSIGNTNPSCVIWVRELGLFIQAGRFNDGVEKGIATSTDGANWTLRSTPTLGGSGIVGLAWSKKRRLVVGIKATTGVVTNNIWISTDGITWTEENVPSGWDTGSSVASGDSIDAIVAVSRSETPRALLSLS